MNINYISNLFYKIKLIERKIYKNFENKTGISLTRYEILLVLFNKENFSQVDLQNFLQIDQAAITRHLKKLEDDGYIVRNRNPQNNRELVINLTEKANVLLIDCDKNCQSLSRFFVEDFSDNEFEKLLILLEKFEKSII